MTRLDQDMAGINGGLLLTSVLDSVHLKEAESGTRALFCEQMKK